MLARAVKRLVMAAVIVVTSAVVAPGLGAQAVRGIVVDPRGQPVVGVVATLLDSASNVVARALSNSTGGFILGAPRAGVYRVRTLRIGYRDLDTTCGVLVLWARRR